jgi:hypothetical protein
MGIGCRLTPSLTERKFSNAEFFDQPLLRQIGQPASANGRDFEPQAPGATQKCPAHPEIGNFQAQKAKSAD